MKYILAFILLPITLPCFILGIIAGFAMLAFGSGLVYIRDM